MIVIERSRVDQKHKPQVAITHTFCPVREALFLAVLPGLPDGFLDGFCFSKWLFYGSKCS
jgi:hypothetical protein